MATKKTKNAKNAPISRNAEPYKNSAGVKLPNADIIIETDAAGVVTSCRDAVTGTEYVGGGGSDFSTCTLTLNNQSNVGSEFNVPAFFDDGEYSWLSTVATFLPNTSSEFLVALYKNMSEVRIDSTVFLINVSGNITSYGEPGIYYITGDCVITLTRRDA